MAATRPTPSGESLIDYDEADMNFGGRWVPMEVMNTIFLLWALAVLIVGVALFWFMRSGRSSKPQQDAPPGAARAKRSKRKKRG